VPTVLRWGPYRAFFYSNEGGEPAHVHVRAGDKEAKFWLHDLVVAINAGLPRTKSAISSAILDRIEKIC
jgi:Domain of unknown function (DUF4160)